MQRNKKEVGKRAFMLYTFRGILQKMEILTIITLCIYMYVI